MRVLILALSVLFLTSCKHSKLDDVIDHSSSMEIQFLDTASGQVVGIYKTNFSGEINMLNKYFPGTAVPQYKCGYEGKIILRGRDTTEVDFSLQNKCQHISFLLDGNVYSEDILYEGVGYLKKLRFKASDLKSASSLEFLKDSLNSAK